MNIKNYKVLFITGSLNQGGAEFQIIKLASLFKRNGISVIVLSLTSHDFFSDYLKKENIPIICLPNNESKLLRLIKCARHLRKIKPDYVVSYLRLPSQVALFAKYISFSNTKIIVGERTSLVLPSYDVYYFNLLRLSNYIITNSITKLDYIKDKFSFLGSKVEFFPNVFDPNEYTKTDYSFDNQLVKLCYVGRLSPEKNVDLLINAIKIVVNKGFNVELNIYGDSRNNEYFIKIISLIKNNSLEDRVKINGRKDDLLIVYHTCDLLCLLSSYEGFSNVLSEALSCGVPILASNIQENSYLVEDNVNGFLVDVSSKNPSTIANGIIRFLNLERNEKLRISSRNREKALSLFNQEKLFERYSQLLNEI